MLKHGWVECDHVRSVMQGFPTRSSVLRLSILVFDVANTGEHLDPTDARDRQT
jgi:hypothetical protein